MKLAQTVIQMHEAVLSHTDLIKISDEKKYFTAVNFKVKDLGLGKTQAKNYYELLAILKGATRSKDSSKIDDTVSKLTKLEK